MGPFGAIYNALPQLNTKVAISEGMSYLFCLTRRNWSRINLSAPTVLTALLEYIKEINGASQFSWSL